MKLELDLLLDNSLFDHPDLLHSLLDRFHQSLFNAGHFLDNADLWSFDHLLDQLDPGLLLLFFPDHGFCLLNGLHLVAHLFLSLELLLQNETLNSLFLWPEHLLAPLHCLHLPLSPRTISLPILLMHMAVLMPMHLISLRSTLASLRRTASSLSNFAPISASLMVAAPTTPRGLTRFPAHTVRILQIASHLPTLTERHRKFIVRA